MLKLEEIMLLVFVIFIVLSSYGNCETLKKIRYGTFPMENTQGEETFKEYQKLGFDHVMWHHNNGVSAILLQEKLNQAWKYGISVIPHLNTFVSLLSVPEPKEEWAQRWFNGEITICGWGTGYPYADARSPVSKRAMKDFVKKVIEDAKDHPGFQIMSLDDEYCYWFDYRGRWLAAYSPWNIAYFKEKTGLEVPMPVYKEPGYIAKDNEPFTLFRKILGAQPDYNPTLTEHNKELKEYAKSLKPDLLVSSFPGGYEGELDTTLIEIYSYLYKGNDLECGYLIDRTYSRMKEKKPLWVGLGWYQYQAEGYGSSLPEWAPHQMSLIAKISLAKGAKMLTLCPYRMVMHTNPDFKPTITELGNIIKEYNSIFVNLERVKMPVAVLHSETTLEYQGVLDWEEAKKRSIETPWKHHQCFDVGYPALWRAHVPMEIISEREILEGKLDEYEALILIDYEYSEESIMKKINEYSEKKLVFADKSCVIKPKKYIEIPDYFSIWHDMIKSGLRPYGNNDTESVNLMYRRSELCVKELIEAIQSSVIPKLNLPVSIDSTKVVYSLAKSKDGKTKYIFLFNSDLQNEQEVKVTINDKLNGLYDVLDKKRVDIKRTKNGISFNCKIKSGDWKIYSQDMPKE